MIYVEAPSKISGSPSIFLAGGITGCPDWQSDATAILGAWDVVVMNPRRTNFDVNNQPVATQQIIWEHQALRHADVIMFWFCAETVQPITLYELGAWSMTDKSLSIGVDTHYPRLLDVEVQTTLARPELPIHTMLTATVLDAIRLSGARRSFDDYVVGSE